MYALFLMFDGRVFAQGYGHGFNQVLNSGSPIIQVRFDPGASICKIIAYRTFIFYISTRGICYFTCTQLRSHHCEGPCLQPKLLQTEAGFFVENVFITEDYIIIQFDGSGVGNIYLLNATGPKLGGW